MLQTTSNNEKIDTASHLPLLCVDVWEHAYCLDYAEDRGRFLKEVWKIVNWKKMEERLEEGTR